MRVRVIMHFQPFVLTVELDDVKSIEDAKERFAKNYLEFLEVKDINSHLTLVGERKDKRQS